MLKPVRKLTRVPAFEGTTATFIDFAKLTVVNAGHLYGSSSVERKAVADAWQSVGVSIKPMTKAAAE
jgi:Zn-dependent metalloprotease